jgi:hypothetical protein
MPDTPDNSLVSPTDVAKQPAQQSPAAQKAQDAAKKVMDAAKQFQKAQQGLQNKTGMKRLVVHGANIVCDATIPSQTQNTLQVVGNRPVIEGKLQANVTDTKVGTNINPWPCQCRNQPMPGGSFKPCSYQPMGEWFPGVRTQPVDSKVPKTGDVPNMEKALNLTQMLQKDHGWSLAQASGAMGNIMTETQWLTAFAQGGGGGGRGWLQWDGVRRENFLRWANKNGINPASDQASSRFLQYEMSGATGNHWTPGYSQKGFMETNVPEQSATYFQDGYERPGVPHSEWRKNTARKIYDQLKNYALCESDTLKCMFGGTISVSNPNQSTKLGDPNNFSGAASILGKK